MSTSCETALRRKPRIQRLAPLFILLLAFPALAEVRISIQETNAAAALRYQCTAGEEIQAFALDLSVSQGTIIAISDFFRGPCTASAHGYGIFPAAFRDHISITSGTNANWDSPLYTPLAVPADFPADTLPGLNTSGVTLELGALWNPTLPNTKPGSSGTLCLLQLTDPATVTVTTNSSRGGVVSAVPGVTFTPLFSAGFVDPVARIIDIALQDAVITLHFRGGELETASALQGPWTPTGNITGLYSESVSGISARFFRIRHF